MYKTAEGKGENKFGLGERAMPSAYAQEVCLRVYQPHLGAHCLSTLLSTGHCRYVDVVEATCWDHAGDPTVHLQRSHMLAASRNCGFSLSVGCSV
jgi:hypothetical protein